MNRPVRTVRPDTTLASIMHAMIEHGGRCMPVVDEQGKVQGIVTVFDVFQTLLSGAAGVASAGRIGSSAPIV